MATPTAERIGLFSIHPGYAQAILDGTKQVEFRKTAPAPDIKIALIYATAPVMKVVGYFEISEVVRATPQALWGRFGAVAGIGKADYDTYYGDAAQACGVAVARAQALAEPVALSSLRPDLRAPQSFQYLDGDSASAATRLIGLHPATSAVAETDRPAKRRSRGSTVNVVLDQFLGLIRRVTPWPQAQPATTHLDLQAHH
jgi:predicted transcriptional regulator